GRCCGLRRDAVQAHLVGVDDDVAGVADGLDYSEYIVDGRGTGCHTVLRIDVDTAGRAAGRDGVPVLEVPDDDRGVELVDAPYRDRRIADKVDGPPQGRQRSRSARVREHRGLDRRRAVREERHVYMHASVHLGERDTAHQGRTQKRARVT